MKGVRMTTTTGRALMASGSSRIRRAVVPARLAGARSGRTAGASASNLMCRASPKGFGLGTGTQKTSQVPAGYKKVYDGGPDLEGKKSKAVVLGTLDLILHEFEGQIYCTEANSSAFKFPLIDAPIAKDAETGVLSIEVPLDGTRYNLETGEVLEWCPKSGNPLRFMLGSLKEKEKPVPLQVYPVVISSDGIYTKYTPPGQ